MIDPRKVTKFGRTTEELEEFLLFSIVVAGKGAFQQAAKLEEFLKPRHENDFTPFYYIMELDMRGQLVERLRAVKMGQYERVSTAFRGVAHFYVDRTFNIPGIIQHPPRLSSVKISYLEVIKGIGMKTARFFLMHTREGQQYACLDTHILKWLGSKGHEVPKTTPRGEKYLALEQIFLGYCNEAGKSAADMDLEIWNSQHVENSSTKNLTSV